MVIKSITFLVQEVLLVSSDYMYHSCQSCQVVLGQQRGFFTDHIFPSKVLLNKIF